MNIKEIRAVPIQLRPNMKTQPRVPKSEDTPDWVRPSMRYSELPTAKQAARATGPG